MGQHVEAVPQALTRGYSSSFREMLSRHPVPEQPALTTEQLDELDRTPKPSPNLGMSWPGFGPKTSAEEAAGV